MLIANGPHETVDGQISYRGRNARSRWLGTDLREAVSPPAAEVGRVFEGCLGRAAKGPFRICTGSRAPAKFTIFAATRDAADQKVAGDAHQYPSKFYRIDCRTYRATYLVGRLLLENKQ